VKIEIIDVPAELIVPAELPATKLLVGDSETLTVELVNKGGSPCEGEVTIDAPWRIEPPAHYRIRANERAILHVKFAPEIPGEFRGEVHYSSHPERLTTVSGTALAPLSIRPAALDLRFESLTGRRLGAFEITNNTATEQSITVHSSERLSLEQQLTLAPARSAAVTIETRPDDVDPLAEVIRFVAPGVEAVLPVRAAAVPPPPPPAAKLPTATPAPIASTPIANPQSKPSQRPTNVRDVPHEGTPATEAEPPGVDALAVTRQIGLTMTGITIEWPAGAPAETCRAEALDVSLRDGHLVKTWRRIGNVKISTAGDTTRAVFTQLQPGKVYNLRIVARASDTSSEEPVAMISFLTPAPPPHRPWITWPRVLGIVLVLLLAFMVGKRLRSRPTGL
jgi:hypothetical protein